MSARVGVLVATLVVLSCIGDSSGPGVPRRGTLLIAPMFESSAAPIVAFDRIRIVLQRTPPSTSIVLDTVVVLGAPTDSVDLDLPVPLTASSETFLLYLALISPVGDTVFRNSPYPDSVTVSAGVDGPPQEIPIVYTGVGFDAATVEITSPAGRTVLFGDTVHLSAVAKDGQGNVIPGTPIAWGSLDTNRAKVPDPALAVVQGATQRGLARIEARLLTGPKDTTTVNVYPTPSAIAADTSPPINLPASAVTRVVARVTATDGLGVADIPVQFAVTLGGGTLSQAVDTTDSTGRAGVYWTLGAGTGLQTVQATRAGLAGSPVTFSTTAISTGPDHLVFSVQPANATAGVGISPAIQVTVQDAANNTVTGYGGNVTVAIGTGPGGAILSGQTTVTASGGIATFSGLSLDLAAAGYTLVASDPGVPTGATSNAFTISPAPATQLAFRAAPNGTTVGAPIAPPVEVEARDQFGNLDASYGGAVTVALANNPTGAALSGTLVVSPSGGVAAFGNLSLDQPGTGFTLVATASALAPDTSVGFNVAAAAGQVYWTNAAGGAWNNPANWSGGIVPGPADVAVITLPGTYTVTLNVDTTVGGLILGGSSGTQTLAANGRIFGVGGVNNVVGVNAVLTFSSTTLTTGLLQNDGVARLQSTTVNGDWVNQGTLHVGGLVALNGGLTTGTTSTIRVQGNNAVGNGQLTLAGGFFNNGQIILTDTVGAYGAALDVTVGTLVNASTGSISTEIGGGGSRQLSAALDNQGSLFVSTAPAQGLTIAKAGATHSNSGSTDVSSGNLTITQSGSGSWTQSGFLDVSGGNFTVNQTSNELFTMNANAFIGSGRTFTVNGGTFDYASGTLSGSGTVALQGGVTATFTPSFSTSTLGLTLASASVDGAGTITNVSGKTISMRSSAIGNPFVNNGTLFVDGNSFLDGAVTTGIGSVIRVQGNNSVGFSKLTVASGFTNNGQIVLTDSVSSYGAAFDVVSGTLVNAAGATLLADLGSGGARQLNAGINNQGTFTANLAGAQTLTINKAGAADVNSGAITVSGGTVAWQLTGASSFDQSGSIDLTGGNFALSQASTDTFTLTGTVTVGTGDTLTVGGGTFNYAAGAAIGGLGTVALQSAVTANFTPSFGNDTLTLSLTSATVNGPGTVTNAAGRLVRMRSSTINAPFITNGTLLVDGTSALSGPLTIGPASLIRVQGNNSVGFSRLTAANGFTNNGQIVLTDSVSSYGAGLDVTSGTLVNAAGATILAELGANGARQLNAEVNNQGTLTVNVASGQSLSVTKSGAADANSGTITVSNGALSINQSGTSSFDNSGTVSLTGGNLSINQASTGSFTLTGAVTVGGGDTLFVSGGTFSYNTGGTLGGTGTVALQGGVTANFTPNFGNDTLALSLASATVNGPGTVTNAAGRLVTIRSSTINAPMVNNGTLLADGTSALGGPVTTGPASLIRVQGNNSVGFSRLTAANGFTNNGQIVLTDSVSSYGAGLDVTSGTLVNAAAASILADSGAGGSRQLNAALNNQGSITASLPLGQVLSINSSGAAHQNSGTITVSSGLVSLNVGTGTFDHSGTLNLPGGRFAISQNTGTSTVTGVVNVAVGQRFEVNGGVFNYNAGGTLTGFGTIVLAGVTANFTPNFSTDSLGLELSTTTLNGPGTVTNAAGRVMGMRSSTINAPFITNGTVFVDGTSALGGTVTTGAASLIRVQGNNSVGFSRLTVASGFTNNGQILLTDTVSTYGAALILNTGTLINAPTASILAELGAGGSRQLNAELDNQGLLTVDVAPAQALTVNRPSAVHQNTGTITLASGKLSVIGAGATFTNGAGGIIEGTAGLDVAAISFSNAGAVQPGLAGAGILPVSGAYAQTATGDLNIELGGVAAGTGYDQLAVTGAVTLGGTLTVTTINSFAPALGDTFTVLTFGSRSGTFSSLVGLDLGGGLILDTLFSGTSLRLVVRQPQLVFTVQPSNVQPFTFFSPAVELSVQDGAGGTITSFNDSVTIALGLNPGNGTLSGTFKIPAVAGVATFADLSLDSLGSGYTLVATAPGVQPDTSAAFSVTPLGTTKQWLGGSTDWFNAANWSPSGIPAGTDNVFIGVSANNPTITNNTTINDLVVQSGATLTITGGITLTAAGDVNAGSTITGGTVAMSGSGVTVSGVLPDVRVTGTVTAAGPTTIAGALFLDLGGTFTVGGQKVTVGANFTSQSASLLRMLSSTDTLDVGGTVSFIGNNPNPNLTSGVLIVRGSGFTQSAGSSQNFAAAGTHKTVFAGTAPQTASFTSPGTSRFQLLEIENPSGVTFNTQWAAAGLVTLSGGPVFGSGSAFLTAGLSDPTGGARWQPQFTVFNGVNPALPDSLLSTVAFGASATLAANLRVVGDLALSSGTFDLGGHHVTVTGNVSDSSVAVLVMQSVADTLTVLGNFKALSGNPSPGLTAGVLEVAGNFTQTAGSNQNFAPSGTHKVRLNGTATQTVSFGTPGSGSSRFQDLEVANAAGASFTTNFTVLGVATLANGSATGTATGTVFGGISDPIGGARWQVQNTIFGGTSLALPDSLLSNVTFTALDTLAADLRVVGNLTVSAGTLDLGGQHVTVTGDASIISTGILAMHAPGDADTLEVLGSFTTNSGNSSTALTAGVMLLAGSFTQSAGSSLNFAASGTHKVVFNGASPQIATFASPGAGTSRFQRLEIGSASGVTFTSAFTALGLVELTNGPIAGAVNGTLVTGISDPTGGSRWQVESTTLSGTGLVLPGSLTTILTFTANDTLVADLQVVGDLTVSSGTLTLGGQHLTVTGTVSITGVGILAMQAPGDADTLEVLGNFSTTTGNPNTGLSAGVMLVGGNFTQTAGSSLNFAASGTHKVVLNGAGTQTVTFSNPGATLSRFQRLELANTGGSIQMTNLVVALGQLTSPSGATTILGGGNTLQVSGLDVDGLVADNVILRTDNGTLTRFDNVTFQGYSPTVFPLQVNHPGLAGSVPVAFNQVQFLVTPTSGGYMSASDNLADANVLTIHMVNSTPLDGSAFTTALNGAVVVWGTAALNSWVNAAGGSWNTASNWSKGTVPTASDSVVIGLNGTYTVTLSASASAASLVLGGSSGTQTLSPGTQTLTLGGPSEVRTNGVLNLTGGTLTGAGTLVVNGALNWSGGIMSGAGVTSIAPGATLNISGAAAKTLSQRTLENGGTAVWTGTGALGAVNLATINNLAGAVFDHQSDAVLTSAPVDSATANNAGTWRKSVGTGVSFLQSATFNNSGTVDVLTGTWEQNGGGTSTGAFTVAAGAVLQFDGTVLQQLGSASSVTGAGTLRVNGSGTTTAVRVGPYNITGTTEVLNGGIAFNGTDTARTRVLVESGGNVAGTGILAVSDTFRWSGGQQSTTGGVTTILPGARLEISGASTKILSQRTLENGGTAVWTGTGQISVVNLATINNLAGAVFDLQNDATISSTLLDSVTVNNSGTWRKSAGTGVSLLSNLLAFENLNLGTVDVASGTLRVNGGTFRNRTGATLQGLGTFDRASAAFLGNGLVLPGAASLAGQLSFTGAYQQGATGALDIELGGVTPVTQHDQLAVSGSATLGGTLNVSLIGGFAPAPGDTFRVMTFASRTGTFTTVTGLTPGGGVVLDTVFDAAGLKVVASAIVTTHATDITANETWIAGVHEVSGYLKVRNGATLIIEDGAQVRFDANAGLQVGDTALAESGALVMAGTQGGGIVLTADTVTPFPGFWRGLEVQRLGLPTTWSNVDIEWAGATRPPFTPSPESCLLMANNSGAVLTLDSVTLQHCVHADIHHFGGTLIVKRSVLDSATGSALHADFNATLEVDSTVFSNAGNEGLQISTQQVKLLPSDGNQFVGNAQRSINLFAEQLPGLGLQAAIAGNGLLSGAGDTILVNGGRADTTVDAFTIFDQPAPYLVTGLIQVGSALAGGATVTLDSGLVMSFTNTGGFQVGDTIGTRRGQIRSRATTTSPALLRGRVPAIPWMGLGLALSDGPDSLQHVSVLHGGNSALFGTQLIANVMVHRSSGANPVYLESVIAAAGPTNGIAVIRDFGAAGTKVVSSEMSSNQGSGLVVLMPDTVQLDPVSSFFGGNFIQSNLQYPVVLSAGALQALGTVSGTGNGRDTMLIADGGLVTRNAQLADYGKPWRLIGGVTVDSGAILSIPPGMAVAFDSTSFLVVGGNAEADLQALGTSTLPILFTPTPGHPDWSGIVFANLGPNSILKNVTIERAGRLPSCPFNCEVIPGAGIQYTNASANGLIFDTVTVRNSGTRALELNPTGVSSVLIRGSRFYQNFFGPMIKTLNTADLTIVASDLYAYGFDAIANSGSNPVSADGNWWGDVAGPTTSFSDSIGRARVSGNVLTGVPATTPFFPGDIGAAAQMIAVPDTFLSGPLGALHAADGIVGPDSLRVRVLDAAGRGVGGESVTYTGDGVLSLASGFTDAGGRAPGTKWTAGTVADTQFVVGRAASVTTDSVLWAPEVLPDSTTTVNWQMIAGLTNGVVSADSDSVAFTSTNRQGVVVTNARDQYGNVTQPTFRCFADVPNLGCPQPYGTDSVRADTIFFTPTVNTPSRFMLWASYDDGVFFDSVVINMSPVALGIRIDRDPSTLQVDTLPATFTFTSLCPVAGPFNPFCQKQFPVLVVDSTGTAIPSSSAQFQWLAPAAPDTTITLDAVSAGPASDTATVSAHNDGLTWLVAVDTAIASPTFGARDSMPVTVLQAPTAVSVTPALSFLVFGDSVVFNGFAVDQGGTPMPSLAIHWRSQPGHEGTVTFQDTSVAGQARVRLDSTVSGLAVVEGWACCGAAGPTDTVFGAGAIQNPITELISATGGGPQAVAFRPATGFTYLATSAGVEVVDPVNRTSNAINVGGGTYGITYNPASDRVYAARTDKVMVVNPTTDVLEDSIAVGDGVNLGHIASDSVNNRVFVPGQSGGVYWLFVISGTTKTVTDSVPLVDLGQGVAYNPTLDRVYVTLYGQRSVQVIDPAALTVVDSLPAGISGGGPNEVAVNPVTNRFYVTVANEGEVWVYDGTADTLITTVFVGFSSFPQGIDVDVVRNKIYVARAAFDGAVAVIDGASNTFLQLVDPGFQAYDVVVNQTDGTVSAARQAGTLLLYFYVRPPTGGGSPPPPVGGPSVLPSSSPRRGAP